MKSKYFMVVLSIFLILLVFVGSASAADVNETKTLSIDESAHIENNNILSVDNNENVLKANEGTFKELANNLSGKTEYTLDRDYVYSEGDEAYVNGIEFN